MTRAWRTLRVQLAAVGFVAIYAPVGVLFVVTSVTENETVETVDGVDITDSTTTERSPWGLVTAVALAPAAAATAWWWAGRAVRPLQQAAETQMQLIEETSHELRTPLSVLTTNADVVLAHPDPTPAVYREGLERSKTAADRMLHTIEALLADARGRARTIDRQPTDLAAIVREVVQEAQVLAGTKAVDLALTAPGGVAAPIDGDAVRRAVANLVDNALKYAPEGSRVEVQVETTPADVTVVVTDHGPGIPPDQQERIFDRFWRGQDDTAGTGLGLPIARQIALAHGGVLTVTSPGPAGDGAQFRLRLRR